MGDIYGDVPVRMCLKCTQILRRQLPNDGCPGEGPTSGTNQSAERWIRLLSNDRFWGLVTTNWQSPICSWICHTGSSPPPPLIINFILLMTIMTYNLYYHDVKNSYEYNAFKMNMYSVYAIAHEKDRITCSICAHKTVTSRFFCCHLWQWPWYKWAKFWNVNKTRGRELKHDLYFWLVLTLVSAWKLHNWRWPDRKALL